MFSFKENLNPPSKEEETTHLEVWVNLSHSPLTGIPVVCLDSGQRRAREAWSSAIMVGRRAQCSALPFLLLREALEVEEAGKSHAPTQPALPPMGTPFCSRELVNLEPQGLSLARQKSL